MVVVVQEEEEATTTAAAIVHEYLQPQYGHIQLAWKYQYYCRLLLLLLIIVISVSLLFSMCNTLTTRKHMHSS